MAAPAWVAPVIQGGFGIGANVANAFQAEYNRDWERYMASTSVQRRMQDLKAAGLNPILAAGDAAASPGSSGPTYQAPEISSALSASQLTSKQLDLMDAQIGVQNATAKKIDQDAIATGLDNLYNSLDEVQGMRLSGARTTWNMLQNELTRKGLDVDPDVLDAVKRRILADAAMTESNSSKAASEAIKSRYEIPEYKAESDFARSKWGKLQPYLNSAKGVSEFLGNLMPGIRINRTDRSTHHHGDRYEH